MSGQFLGLRSEANSWQHRRRAARVRTT